MIEVSWKGEKGEKSWHIPHPRSGAEAKRNYPMAEVRGSSQEELCCIPGQRLRPRVPHVCVLVIPWTVACQAPLSMGILQARILEWVAIPSSRGIFPGQGSNPGLPHWRQIVYHVSHQMTTNLKNHCSKVSSSLILCKNSKPFLSF